MRSSATGAATNARFRSIMTLPISVVLVEPEIPNNTGSIGRTCVALGAQLQLVHPLGFDLSEKACRRAGLDYWPRLDLVEHDSWEAYRTANPAGGRGGRGGRGWSLTTKADRSIFDAEFEPGDHLVFGRESAGLVEHQLEPEHERRLALPMLEGERSLNLSNAATAVLYEVVRQFASRGIVQLNGARLG